MSLVSDYLLSRKKNWTKLSQKRSKNVKNWGRFSPEKSRELQPRYHFAGAEQKHYERRPYKNHQSDSRITRFIALASVGNPGKEKYLYAFNITPNEKTTKIPDDVTQE